MFRRFLGGVAGPASQQPAAPPSGAGTPGDADAVRRIVARLESMPPDKARRLAITAYILARAANADLDISDVETSAMERELVDEGLLDEAQAVLVVEMAKLQERTTGETSDFIVTREFAEHASLHERQAMLRACYHIAVADDSIDSMESSALNQIASELLLTREEAAAIRAEFAEKVAARRGLQRS